jgi:hypothetical protein
MPLTCVSRLAPGPQALDQEMLADKLGYERVRPPEVPAALVQGQRLEILEAVGNAVLLDERRLNANTAPEKESSGAAKSGPQKGGSPSYRGFG